MILCLIILASSVTSTFSQVGIPSTNDVYAGFVTRLESGDTTVSFKDFRFSFLDRKDNPSAAADEIRKQIRSARTFMQNEQYAEALGSAQKAITLDYTSLAGQYYMSEAYSGLGDTVNYKKYYRIFDGLIQSILTSGDGKTCETAWQVVKIEEEYFILNVIRVRFTGQSLIAGKKENCDKMEGTNEAGDKVRYYFGIDAFFGKMFK